jgi:hypothetical protein
MFRYRAWLALPVLAGLILAHPTAARAAAGDTVQTTGGGWFTPSPAVILTSATLTGIERAAGTNNTKATFGFVASATYQADGTTLGDFQGELSYNDHGLGLKLHSVSVTSVSVSPHPARPTVHTAIFTGTADVTTGDGSFEGEKFTVMVQDVAEPGVGVDTFDIELPNLPVPYHVHGTLGGGNIQVRP